MRTQAKASEKNARASERRTLSIGEAKHYPAFDFTCCTQTFLGQKQKQYQRPTSPVEASECGRRNHRATTHLILSTKVAYVCSPPRALHASPAPNSFLPREPLQQGARSLLKGRKAFPKRNHNRKQSLSDMRNHSPLSLKTQTGEENERGGRVGEDRSCPCGTTTARSRVTLACAPPHKATHASANRRAKA